MTQFVQDGKQQIFGIRGSRGVETIVPTRRTAKAPIINIAVKGRGDLRICAQISAGNCVSARAVVQSVRKLCVGKVPVPGERTSRAESCRCLCARLRVKLRSNARRDAAVQVCSPDLPGKIEKIQPLLTQRGAKIAALGCTRCR